MIRIFLFAIAGLWMQSCNSKSLRTQTLISSGAMQIENLLSASEKLRIRLKNTKDIGWNGDNAKDRIDVVEYYLSTKCSEFKIEKVENVETGIYVFDKPAITWIYDASCKWK